MNANHLTVAGHAVAAPTLKTIGKRDLAEFRLAYNRKPRDGETESVADFFTVKVWGRNAAAVAKFIDKGDPVIVCGPMRHERWQGDDGKEHERYAIDAFIVGKQVVGPKKEEGQ